MKKHLGIYKLLLLSLIGLMATGCKNHKDKPTVMPPVKVKVMEIGEGGTGEGRQYSGTVTAANTVTVSFSVAGTITQLNVKEGDKVSKGQLLGSVRNGEYLNAYNMAAAELAEAQDGYNRLKKLHDANALPDVKWVEIQQKLKQAENAAAMAKRTLDDANLHSPVSGTVTQKFADVGETVVPVQPVYEIMSTNDLTIDISVSENEIGNFKEGETGIVKLDALEGEIKGKVTQKSVSADPLTRGYMVKLSIGNEGGKVLPGMLGTVSFPTVQDVETQLIGGYTLPSQAVLLNDDNRWFVWVVADSVAERRFVTADELVANGVVVTSGLQKGDRVIVEGVQKVGSGTIVSVE